MDVGADTHAHRNPPHAADATTARATGAKKTPMDALIIEGGRPLTGRIPVSGAKNAALPVMAAALLTPGQHVLRNVPSLADTRTMARVLEKLGARIAFAGNVLTIDTTDVDSLEAPYDLVRTMRASIYVLGPLLARFGNARVSLPGGCAWGPRPVNLHIEGLDAMGASLEIDHGYIVGKDVKLKGAHIRHDVVSVGATAQLMMAATLASGTTVIEGAAVEPDVAELGKVLIECGAKIDGLGTRVVSVHGVTSLKPIDCTIIPDRIEAATFLGAAAITGGSVTIEHCDPEHLTATIEMLTRMGCDIHTGPREVTISGPTRPASLQLETRPYPGFPTDMQPQMMALCAIADGTSVITDTIYLDRFSHVPELARLGARITLDHNVATIEGVSSLQGAQVMATDIRASAALVMAALTAHGKTKISRIYHLDRGYEALVEKLSAVGARIERVKE